MVPSVTFSINTTDSRARIAAFILYTRLIRRTIRVYDTFRFATFIRISKVFWQALTCTCSILFATDCIDSTRVWTAWGNKLRWLRILQNVALWERIASMTCSTQAHRGVADNMTLSIGSTETWAWIFTLLIDASQMAGTFRAGDTFGSTIWWTTDEFCKARTWWCIAGCFALSSGRTVMGDMSPWVQRR